MRKECFVSYVCRLNAAKTSMSSKIIGAESEFFANLAVTAALRVKIEKDGKAKCPISNIHILKSHGQVAEELCASPL